MNHPTKGQGRCPYCLYPLEGERCDHCRPGRQQPNPPDQLPLGHCLAGRYTVGQVVHMNSEATLYAAYDTVSDTVVSLREYYPKVLSVRTENGNIVPKAGKEVQFKALRMDFEEVCRYLSRQRPDSCILPCIDVLPCGDTVYGIFEEPRSQKLEDYLEDRGGRIPWTEIKKPFLQLLGTVSTFNRTGIIHRGISPTTLHRNADGRIVLTGFGTSAFRTGHSEIEAELFYGYAAPEQYTQRGWQGNWTDVYALGAVLYRILTGQRPADYHGRLTGEVLTPPEDFDPTIPHHVSEAILKALTLNVEERYQSADSFYTGLLEAGDSNTAVFDSSNMPPQRKKKNKTRHSFLIGAGSATLVLIAVVFFLYVTGLVPAFGPGGESSESEPSSESDSLPPEEPEPLIMPGLLGRNFDELLKDGEFISTYTLSEPVEIYHDTVATGLIVEQDPAEGTELTDGQRIRVTVSLGPEYTTMPNIIGWSIEEAKRELERWGIPYHSDVLQVVGENYEYGKIVRTSIDPGTEFSRKDNTVYLYTGRP